MLRFSTSKSKVFFIQYSLFILTPCSLFFFPNQAKSQIKYELEAQAIGTTNGVVPFWMRSNQYGSIPMAGASTSFLGRAVREYDFKADTLVKKKLWDWGMGLEGQVNTNIRSTEFILAKGYLKGRLGPFELRGGRSKETMGLTGDTILSSGSFAVSGNALGIPKVQISIPEYYTVPFFRSIFALKGSFAHGWIGKVPILDKIQPLKGGPVSYIKETHPETYLHQKSLYGRFGRTDWPVKLIAGFNHQVFWGNERKSYGSIYELSNSQTFLYVLKGKSYGNSNIPRSKIGNQLGSIDLALEIDIKHLNLIAYRQNIYDVGALYYFANIRDGLNGITIRNKHTSHSNFMWKMLLFEIFYSKNQAGEIWSKTTPSGDEDYYNNYYYKEGWSFKRVSLGNPLISTLSSVRKGLASHANEYFINNRVIALHLGMEIRIWNWDYVIKTTFSENYGTFGTSTTGHSTGKHKQEIHPGELFGIQRQLSTYLQGGKVLNNNYSISLAVGIDHGNLLYNSEGLKVSLSKKF